MLILCNLRARGKDALTCSYVSYILAKLVVHCLELVNLCPNELTNISRQETTPEGNRLVTIGGLSVAEMCNPHGKHVNTLNAGLKTS
jgi:hypothetical protein